VVLQNYPDWGGRGSTSSPTSPQALIGKGWSRHLRAAIEARGRYAALQTSHVGVVGVSLSASSLLLSCRVVFTDGAELDWRQCRARPSLHRRATLAHSQLRDNASSIVKSLEFGIAEWEQRS
jgi:hypothetical protein